MNDVPVTADPIQDEMTEEERRALLQAIIEELTESGASNALGAIGDLDNKSTEELAERAARMIERAQQNRQVDLFLSGTRWHSINQRWQRRLGRGPDGAMTESLAAQKARQALQEAASINPSQSYASARQVFENARRYGKAAGVVGKVIDAGGALYSGDANKVMRAITSMVVGGIATALAGLAAAMLIGAGTPVAMVAAGAAAIAGIGYLGGKQEDGYGTMDLVTG
ncbi:hypothetical protein CO613_08960 [Lysobacteraceae bacterium NML07-0707]|nr:hypothetical protein CO613_08960 [Xanthomonadaceae bacterium NML07-0707]